LILFGSSNCCVQKSLNSILDAFSIVLFILIIRIIVQVTALLETLEFQESARHKGHIALYNCLVLGHTKYNGVQRVCCNQFPAKPFPVGDTGTILHCMCNLFPGAPGDLREGSWDGCRM
jgi:hypothetical protein